MMKKNKNGSFIIIKKNILKEHLSSLQFTKVVPLFTGCTKRTVVSWYGVICNVGVFCCRNSCHCSAWPTWPEAAAAVSPNSWLAFSPSSCYVPPLLPLPRQRAIEQKGTGTKLSHRRQDATVSAHVIIVRLVFRFHIQSNPDLDPALNFSPDPDPEDPESGSGS